MLYDCDDNVPFDLEQKKYYDWSIIKRKLSIQPYSFQFQRKLISIYFTVYTMEAGLFAQGQFTQNKKLKFRKPNLT